MVKQNRIIIPEGKFERNLENYSLEDNVWQVVSGNEFVEIDQAGADLYNFAARFINYGQIDAKFENSAGDQEERYNRDSSLTFSLGREMNLYGEDFINFKAGKKIRMHYSRVVSYSLEDVSKGKLWLSLNRTRNECLANKARFELTNKSYGECEEPDWPVYAIIRADLNEDNYKDMARFIKRVDERLNR